MGQRPAKEYYVQLMAHPEDRDASPAPEAYQPSFYQAAREAEKAQAHGLLSARLGKAVDGVVAVRPTVAAGIPADWCEPVTSAWT
jgi:hypothetical protein